MSNKVSSKSVSRLLDNKLAIILNQLKVDLQNNNTAEKEEILMRLTKIINKFYKTLTSPLLRTETFRQGTFADLNDLNERFIEIEQDIQILYKELNSLESFLVSNYNSLSTQATALRGRLRRAASKLGDFRLYAKDNLGGALYFTDTFQSTEKIDYNKEKYEQAVASIDIMAGNILLPINSAKSEKYDIAEISIGSGSNGVIGNNQELGALYRGNLKSISDSNADTWFEYEKVSPSSSILPLILELKFKLEKEAVVNVLSFSTTAFATRSYPKITKLEISKDGKTYTDLMDKIDLASFLDKENTKAILLNPSAGKFSGISRVKIPPSKARYIKVVIQQDDSYLIKTSSGIKYRKAIGIRDVDISGEQYYAKGEIVSAPYTAPSEIKKVSLLTKEDNVNNLTNIKHYVSIDEGQNWHQIQSQTKFSNEVKEVLSFNLEGVDSIVTSSPSASIRYKAILERENQGNITEMLSEKKEEKQSDFIRIDAGTKTITLTKTPVKDSVKIKNISYGSVGGNQTFLFGSNTLLERDGFLYAHLPLNPFFQNSIKKDHEIIIVDKEPWERVDDISIYNPTDTVYEFDYINNIIKFGNNINGKKPEKNISLKLKRESVTISADKPRVVELTYDFDGVKESTSIYQLLDEKEKINHLLPKKAKILRLNQTDVINISIVSDQEDVLLNEKNFINGSSELQQNGDYSIDRVNGIVYTYKETDYRSDLIINYTYYPRKNIEDFKIQDGKIIINEADFVTTSKSKTINIPSPVKSIEVEKNIEPKSIKILTLNNLLKTEVLFKGDGSEFDIGLSPADLEGYFTVDYKNGIIYAYSDIQGELKLEYNTSNYYAEYNIAVSVPEDSFKVNSDNTIDFTDKYILQTFNNSLDNVNIRSLFKVDYNYIIEIEQNPKELEPYITPALKEYSLAILTKDNL